MMNGAGRVGLLGGAIVAVVVATALAAGAGYAIDAPGAVEGPTQTIDVGGQSFTLDTVLVVDPGDTATFDVTAPDNESYRLYRYDSEGSIQDSTRATGSTTFDRSFAGVDSGSYVMAVVPDSSPVAVQPVLVPGYSLSVSTTVDGDSATVTVESTQTAENADSIQELLVSVETASGVQNVTAEPSGEGYRAEIDLGSFESGDHRMLAVARGDRGYRGEREVIAFSQSTLSVPDDTGGNPGASTPEVTMDTETATPTATPTTTESPTSTTETPSATTETQATTTASETPTAVGGGAETTDDGVIQPRTSTPTATGGPGFSTGLALVATLAGAVAIGRRR
ncbi:hypothetical protein [Halococcoides cellulosivorans]|nr:hypothetical protein [Halococcoides cellulosivorans]